MTSIDTLFAHVSTSWVNVGADRVDDQRMGRSRIVRGAFFVLAIGLLLSSLATVLTVSHARERRADLVVVAADALTAAIDRHVSDGVAVHDEVGAAIDGTWVTAAQYEALALRAMATLPAGGRLQSELVVEEDGAMELLHRVAGAGMAEDRVLDLATAGIADELLTSVTDVDLVRPDGVAVRGLHRSNIDLRAIADLVASDTVEVTFRSDAAALDEQADDSDPNRVVRALTAGGPVAVEFIAADDFAAAQIPDPMMIALVCGFLTLLAAALTASLLGVHEVGERLTVSEHDADHDELTGTWNRRRLVEELATFTAPVTQRAPIFGHGSRRVLGGILPGIGTSAKVAEPQLLAILFCDLDRFKVVNDSVGHSVGDAVLTATSRRLAALHPKGGVTRFGGDEFVLTVPVASADEATDLAESLRTSVGRELEHEGSRYSVTASVGVVLAERGSEVEPSDLLRDADMAAYSAKSAGGDAVVLFDDALRTAALDRLDIEQALRLAMTNDEFDVHYQPLTDAAGQVVSLEALVRWDRPGHGLVPPSQFLATASEIGLIVELGQRVMRRACEDGARWLRDLPSDHPLTMNVNVDIEQLLDPDLCKRILSVVTETEFPADRLVLEITENALPGITEPVRLALETLREAGVEFSIDDFGTGHSSLERLVLFDEVSEVKIDRSFTSRVDSSVAAMAVVKAIVLLAQEIDLRIVLEGVERPEEILATDGLGISAYQGYLLGKPVEASVVTRSYLIDRVPSMPNLARTSRLVELAGDVRDVAGEKPPVGLS